ncbi:sugar MFS transporter [Croceibacter atlanticus]|jgi:FHS family L-fucose permease-like MFS transporter|uniref:Glucose/galactose transporter n=1 Tax=Croceibacter atlanticus (strain ATCC BAA-628 / JCM 21780 / CIP 108009 / IAM 15332 / KCTC 12090 / HTCC2559) TaxID=216432 RepID=A3UBV2_CROAH|nr:sugar MFS transporter [Croceibacter atlanticus]EAP86103.1 glucose/galactose transporter [Croceibacter atlanticus HTCC2559]WSP33780.1 sugar MFS transporter [Croceibacter atlanticus]
MSNNAGSKRAFAIITTLFFLWGFITVLVDSLIPRLKDVFELSYFQAGLVQFAFFLAYFIFSIPAGSILARIGYKKGIILGLLTMAFGCLLFYPASEYRMFNVFLLGYFILAAGITVLQVAANPYVSLLGSEQGASSRLNLAQAFNSLGTTIAPIIGALFLLSETVKTSTEINALSIQEKESYLTAEAATVQTPFLTIAAIIGVLAVVFMIVKLPTIMEKSPKGGYSKLFKNKLALMGVLGIFLYVGAEVAIGSYLVNYFQSMRLTPIILENETMMAIANTITNVFNKDLSVSDPKSLLGIFVIFYWGGAMIGRFIGAYLTKLITPGKVLGVFSFLAILMIFTSMNTLGLLSMWTILSVGLFNSIMFPTIFTLTLDGLGDLKPQASGLLCTAIVGGAIIPPLYGFLTDQFHFKLALLLIVLCYAYILYFGWIKSKVSVRIV